MGGEGEGVPTLTSKRGHKERKVGAIEGSEDSKRKRKGEKGVTMASALVEKLRQLVPEFNQCGV